MFYKIISYAVYILLLSIFCGSFIVACENDQQRNDEQNLEWAKYGNY